MSFEDIKKIKNIENIIKDNHELLDLIKQTKRDIDFMRAFKRMVDSQIDEIKNMILNKIKN